MTKRQRHAAAQRRYYAKLTVEQRRAIERRRKARGPRPDRTRKARRARQNPDQRRANRKVRNAIDRGELVRPMTCSINDDTCLGRIEAHHENYDKPLDVIWLCKSHHIRHHRTNQEVPK